jgi:MbtH protein
MFHQVMAISLLLRGDARRIPKRGASTKGARKMAVRDDDDPEANWIFNVVINDKGQYSILPERNEPPLGWRKVGKSGLQAECLEYIDQVWTDLRPKAVSG